jgi:NADH-quinone oxidoreductase subunit J
MNAARITRWVIALSLLSVGSVFAQADVAQAAASSAVGALNQPNQGGAVLMFWLMSLGAVAGSIFVVTRRNMISAVMGMVGTFFAFAGLYAMLYAHFLAVIQVLVYAGAIMVLFVFVIMILNRAEDEEGEGIAQLLSPANIFSLKTFTGVLGLAGVGYLFLRLSTVLWTVQETAVKAIPVDLSATSDAFGTTRAMGKVLFTKYLFPFEAVSIVLLVAVVGSITIARPSDPTKDEKGEEA